MAVLAIGEKQKTNDKEKPITSKRQLQVKTNDKEKQLRYIARKETDN